MQGSADIQLTQGTCRRLQLPERRPHLHLALHLRCGVRAVVNRPRRHIHQAAAAAAAHAQRVRGVCGEAVAGRDIFGCLRPSGRLAGIRSVQMFLLFFQRPSRACLLLPPSQPTQHLPCR